MKKKKKKKSSVQRLNKELNCTAQSGEVSIDDRWLAAQAVSKRPSFIRRGNGSFFFFMNAREYLRCSLPTRLLHRSLTRREGRSWHSGKAVSLISLLPCSRKHGEIVLLLPTVSLLHTASQSADWQTGRTKEQQTTS